MIEERQEIVAKQKAEAQLITDTWDSLAGQGLQAEKDKEELRRRKEVILVLNEEHDRRTPIDRR